MTTILPILELKYNKETTSSSTITNTINNNIIVKPTFDNLISEIPSENIVTDSSVKKSHTPQNISEFKEALIVDLISYFKNNVVLITLLSYQIKLLQK
jgi:hypothetical protein